MKFIKQIFATLLISTVSVTAFSASTCQMLSQWDIPTSTAQIIFVQGQFNNKDAILSACSRTNNNKWKPAINSFAVVVGKNGVAEQGQKKEGDGKTPSGLYFIGEAFGYYSSLGKKLKIDYRYITPNKRDKFIDDINSEDYNTWVIGPTHASSFEIMRRDDSLYDMGAVIEYNKYPIIKGAGSAIFLHIARPERTGTAGCIAMDKNNLSAILYWLDKEKNPQILIVGQ